MKYMSEVGYILYTATYFIIALQHCNGESCSNRGDVRLQNGANKFEGRVEVCEQRSNNNTTMIWKIVCNAGWDMNEAMVVCRQLRFSGNLTPTPERGGAFSSGQVRHTDYIGKKNFTCQGEEEKLLNCTYYNQNVTYCNESQSKPAGVYCFDRNEEQKHCSKGDIRLNNSTDIKNVSGRVEVCLDGLWGTVCDDGWDINDATAVCRQLGYTDIIIGIPTTRAYFGEGSGPIHLSKAQCRNDDTRLIDCAIDKTGINGCVHSEDAGVICMGSSNCDDFDVQLVGGESEREGRVEICYNGVWGTVCDYGWDQMDANVVCQQLGFNYQRALPTNNSHFGDGEGPILLENVRCNQIHSNLSQCVDLQQNIGTVRRCMHTAGVICEGMMSTSTTSNQATTTSPHATTTNISHDSTYVSHDTYTPTAPVGSGSSTSDSTATVAPRSSILPIIYGIIISGVLVIIGVTVSIVIIVLVIMRKRVGEMKNSDKKSSMDNPTYDESISTTATPSRIISNEEESLFQNPLYSDVGHRSTNHPYEDTPNGRDVTSERCYSALDHSTEYFTLEPHIPKSDQEQLQHSDDDYSQLHHK